MIPDLPLFVSLFFILTTLLTLFLLLRCTLFRWKLPVILLAWLIVQAIITATGFYLKTDAMPPRFLLLTGPAMLTILLLFLLPEGRSYIDSLDPENLTWIHIVRVPVELVLYWLFIYKQVPELMTFEGRNFDILSGLTAPLIVYFGFRKKVLSPKILIAWNSICLALLLSIVINAVLSAPFPIQQFALDQPNVAVFYFPFSWLPGFIVPVVLFSHLASIRYLQKLKKGEV